MTFICETHNGMISYIKKAPNSLRYAMHLYATTIRISLLCYVQCYVLAIIPKQFYSTAWQTIPTLYTKVSSYKMNENSTLLTQYFVLISALTTRNIQRQ